MSQNRVNKMLFSKTELATHRVDLSIVGDIKKALNESKSLDAKGYKSENKLTDLNDKVEVIKDKYEQAGDDAKALLSQMKDNISKSSKLLASAKESAKALGVSPSDITGWFDLQDATDSLTQTSERLNKEIKFSKG